MELILTVVGLALLLGGGDKLVLGAVALSRRLGVSPLIIGLSVVAFGTTAPELIVSISAAVGGTPGVATGNIVGSNIANILLVLGLPALLFSLDSSGRDARRSYGQMVGAAVLMILLCLYSPLGFVHAAVLLSCLVLLVIDLLREARNGRAQPFEEAATQPGELAPRHLLASLVAGVLGLVLGAQLLIRGAVGIAEQLGVSDEVIGLSLVAIGTSLPELGTTVMAAYRQRADIALGNVIGANLLNILSILGFVSLFGPIEIDARLLARDLWVMLAAILILAPAVFLRLRLTRLWGAFFLLAYTAYTVSLFS